MKSLTLVNTRQFELQDVPVPELGPEDVLVRVRAVGICGSDVHGMDGSSGRRQPPITMGHEAAGEVAAVGSAVTDWAEGDRVTMDSTVYCGRCGFCRAGRINLCDRRMVLGVSCGDYRRAGCFAEYVAVPERILYRLPEGLSYEHAAMVEPVSIAVHAVRRSGLSVNESALVVGAGMIGQLLIQVLRAAECGTLIAVDIDEAKLELARRSGADHAILAEGAAEAIQDLTDGGVRQAFEVVGATAPLQTALDATRKGGTVTLVGNLAPEVTLPLQWVVTRELNVLGSCASCGEYPDCLELMARGAIRVDLLISETASLEEGADWFRRLYAKEPGLMKVILKP